VLEKGKEGDVHKRIKLGIYIPSSLMIHHGAFCKGHPNPQTNHVAYFY
jgi:hypothetical protein